MADSPTNDDEAPTNKQLAYLRGTLLSIREDLDRLLARVYKIEGQLHGSSAPYIPPSEPPQSTVDSVPHGTAASLQQDIPSSAHETLTYSEARSKTPPPWRRGLYKISRWDWDWLLGGNWLARIGIVAVTIGVGFFLKLAFDNDWIGETGRVILGIVVGLALLGIGEYWQRRYPTWAQPITGGGIAILYLSIFAAFSLYDIIPNVAAFGFFFLVTLAAAGLALKYESMTIAILGIVGGFITPILLSDKLPDERLLIAYVLLLDLGVLGLATVRNWRWFTLISLVGSLGLYLFWQNQLEPSLLLSQLGITFIFLIFIGTTTIFHILWRKTPGAGDQALMVINAAAYFGISYELLFDEFRPWMGGFTLLLSLLYGLLGYAVLMKSRENLYLSLFALGIAVVFLTIAIPVQLGGPWVSVAWATEGAVLIWLSSRLDMRHIRLFGVAVFMVFTAYLLVIDIPAALRADLRPFLNATMATYALAIGITYLTAYILYRERQNVQAWEIYLFPTFLAAGNLLLTISIPIQTAGIWMAVGWSVEAIVLMWLSFRLGLFEMRVFSLGMLAIVTVRLLVFDTNDVDLETFRPILNLRFVGFATGIGSLSLTAYFLWVWKERIIDQREKYMMPVVLGVANFLTLWILSAEIISSVDSKTFDVDNAISADVKSLSLSILWAVYAAAAIVLGIARRWRSIRLAGLGLLTIPILKLFVLDVFLLDQGYRVAAFMGLGAILVLGGFLYQRYRRAIRGFLLE